MTVDIGGGVQLYRRAEWGARPPRSRTNLNPTFGSTVHWEGPHMGSFLHDRCDDKVRSIQNFHMDSRGWSDIAYTALVCSHGFVFEGRWVGVRTAANGTTAGNNQAYAVCYLGGVDDPFTSAAKRAFNAILIFLDRSGGAGPGVNCHRDWKPTECPGNIICAWVKAGRPVPIEPPAPPQEDDVPYFTVYTSPGKPARVVVDGALVGFPNPTELGEFLAPYRASGYVEKRVNFIENDEWDRFMGAGPLRAETAIRKQLAASVGYFAHTTAGQEINFVLGDHSGRIPPGPLQDWVRALSTLGGVSTAPVVIPAGALAEIPVIQVA